VALALALLGGLPKGSTAAAVAQVPELSEDLGGRWQEAALQLEHLCNFGHGRGNLDRRLSKGPRLVRLTQQRIHQLDHRRRNRSRIGEPRHDLGPLIRLHRRHQPLRERVERGDECVRDGESQVLHVHRLGLQQALRIEGVV
jgi:hypothetical protein